MRKYDSCVYRPKESVWCEEAKVIVTTFQMCEVCEHYKDRVEAMREHIEKSAGIMDLLEDMK